MIHTFLLDYKMEMHKQRNSSIVHTHGLTNLMKLVLSASKNNNIEQLIKKEIDKSPKELHKTNKCGMTALHLAVLQSGSDSTESVVEMLINCKADVNRCDSTDGKWQPIHYAAAYSGTSSTIRTIDILLNEGANINATTRILGTALHLVCGKFQSYAHPSSVNLLIERNANVNILNKNKMIPLNCIFHYAGDLTDSYNTTCMVTLNNITNVPDKIKMIQYLLDSGSNINNTDINGVTAMHYICTYSKIFGDDLIKYFLKCGADQTIDNYLTLVCNNLHTSNISTAKILFDHMIETIHPTIIRKKCALALCGLITYSPYEHIEDLVYLLCSHTDTESIRFVDPIQSLIHKAVRYSRRYSFDVIKSLINLGYDINCRDSDMNTPLHTACLYSGSTSSYDTVCKLVVIGANTSALNHHNKRPFDYLEIRCSSFKGPEPYVQIPLEMIIKKNDLELLKCAVENNEDFFMENLDWICKDPNLLDVIINTIKTLKFIRSVKAANPNG